ncbi:endonuclease [Massilibacteroides sp.]|uniref:endonuclease/exonuclease/phosphatase family protein n=1 Tax=Massilibacteroides sp. TaxID=2034766 RepID=UPI002612508C|nr:endonuclease [Massilibacteroides sp.]MDD4515948.1 endonuclease [Massilibacteroides sp.]
MNPTLTFIFILILFSLSSAAQTDFRVMSYNVENLFDTEKSPDKNDSEFQPEGKRFWNKGRYYHKLQQIAKVISAAGEWDTPALVALCEVENDSVLTHLLKRTPLRKQDYRYCITTGKDERGINSALLYQRDKFRYIYHCEHQIPFSNPEKKSRNILHVTGRIITQDSLDVFVCHFPSRYGGEKESEQARIDATKHLRHLTDSLHKERETCLILIMGDFNDIPQDKSLSFLVNPEPALFNLFYHAKGSHKYRDTWSQLDQIIVNSTLHQHLKENSPHVFMPSFLLTKDKTWRGKRPLRTYHGYKYEKGFSDHLPIMADFRFHVDQ